MKIIFLILYLLLISKIVFSKNLFETDEYILKFESDNITFFKEKKINEIKIKSFKKILSNILTKKNYHKIEIDNILFVNKFILNFKINDENIINKNYYSKVKVNFNKNLIIDYLIDNKIEFIDRYPSKFLIIIYEENNIKNNLLSSENNFYKFLNYTNNNLLKDNFIIPDLDFNDRFIFDKNNFLNDNFAKNNRLNSKYQTEYQILLHSKKENNFYNNVVFFYFENKKYLLFKYKIHLLNYDIFFTEILFSAIDQWKKLNQIDPNIVNTLNCKININNIYELGYVRRQLKNNKMIKTFNLKSIKLNENLYEIKYFGYLNIFKNTLYRNRLDLLFKNDSCFIKLI